MLHFEIAGATHGPLAGRTVAVKDLFECVLAAGGTNETLRCASVSQQQRRACCNLSHVNTLRPVVCN